MDKIDKIRQEIKRRYDYENEMYHKKKPDGRPNDGWAESLAIMGVLEELLTFLDTLSEEPDKSLGEAAEKKYPVYWKDYPKDGIARSELSYDTNKQCREAFIAGAEWQYQKDRGEFAKIKAKTWCEGFDAHKEQMLKDAVEAEVLYFGETQDVSRTIKIPQMQEWLKPFKDGDKVRIVILKQNEE